MSEQVATTPEVEVPVTHEQKAAPIVTQQPAAAATMTVLNPKGLPFDALGERDYAHGLFEIDGECLVACVAPCISYANTETRMNALASGQVALNPDPMNQSCGIFTALACCGIPCILQGPQRGLLRARYNIRGNPNEDFAITWCCSPCALSQGSKTLRDEEIALHAAASQ